MFTLKPAVETMKPQIDTDADTGHGVHLAGEASLLGNRLQIRVHPSSSVGELLFLGLVLLLADQAFGQGREFRAGIGAPNHAPVRQHAHNRPVRRASQRLDTVPG